MVNIGDNVTIDLQEVKEEYENGPHWQLMGYQVRSLDFGSVSLEFLPREEFKNINGTIHGGVLASLLDTTMGMTARTLLKGAPLTIQLSIQYLKPALNDKQIYTKSKVINRGRSTCFIEGYIYNQLDEVVAYSSGSFKVG